MLNIIRNLCGGTSAFTKSPACHSQATQAEAHEKMLDTAEDEMKVGLQNCGLTSDCLEMVDLSCSMWEDLWACASIM